MKSAENHWRAVVLVTIVLLAVSAAAQEKSNPISHDEEMALGGTRTINTAELTYGGIYKTGYSRILAELGETTPGQTESASRANLIDFDLAKGRKHDHIFAYTPGSKDKDGRTNTYTLTVRPAKWHKGLVSYFSDQTGVIRWTRENRAATVKDPTIDSLPGAE